MAHPGLKKNGDAETAGTISISSVTSAAHFDATLNPGRFSGSSNPWKMCATFDAGAFK